MKKLIRGIVEFRRNVQQNYRELFGQLALNHSPDTLFIACSDSRVVPNTFASTNPGDLFVLRNVGNLIPSCNEHRSHENDGSESAAIEFAILNLSVRDIIVCGHSECGAMRAIIADRSAVTLPSLKSWLRHGDESMEKFKAGKTLDASLAEHNQLSQLNVLVQIEHIKSYPAVKKKIEEGKLAVHAWWFDIAKADVYAFEEALNRFVLIDEKEAEILLKRFSEK